MLSEFEPEGVLASAVGAGLDGLGDPLERLADTSGLLVDLGGVTLAVQDGALLDALSDVDLGLALSLRVEDLATLDTLALGLELHRTLDFIRGLDVLNFIAHAFDSPLY